MSLNPEEVRLDDVVHQQSRLKILAVLSEGEKVRFGTLRELVELTDGNLSRHLSILEEASYVKIDKGYDGRKPRTWLSITKTGRKALEEEVNALRAIVAQVDTGGISLREEMTLAVSGGIST